MTKPPEKPANAASRARYDDRDLDAIFKEAFERYLSSNNIEPACAMKEYKEGKLKGIKVMPGETLGDAELSVLSEICPLKKPAPPKRTR